MGRTSRTGATTDGLAATLPAHLCQMTMRNVGNVPDVDRQDSAAGVEYGAPDPWADELAQVGTAKRLDGSPEVERQRGELIPLHVKRQLAGRIHQQRVPLGFQRQIRPRITFLRLGAALRRPGVPETRTLERV